MRFNNTNISTKSKPYKINNYTYDIQGCRNPFLDLTEGISVIHSL